MKTGMVCVRILGVGAVALLLQSCGAPKSSSTGGPTGGPIPTGQMTLDLKVESSEPGKVEVRANLNDGHTVGHSFRLDGGDTMRACLGTLCRDMNDNNSIYEPNYIARFDFMPGVDYVVSLRRKKGGSAPNTRVALPPDFTLVTPANHQQVTDGEMVIVEWTPQGAPARVEVSYNAECVFGSDPSHGFSSGLLGRDSDGDGRETVDIDEIVTFAQSISALPISRCSIDVFVKHVLQGRLDPAYRGGTVVGIVSRKATLDYVPH